MLRVHSKDLHDHVVVEIGDCLSSGLFTDIQVNCKDGEMLYAHKAVLSAVSPFLKALIRDSSQHGEDIYIDLSHHSKSDIENMLSLIYSGSIDATVEEIKRVLMLSTSLYIPVPVSDQLVSILGIDLASMGQPPPLQLDTGPKPTLNPGALSMLQQQIMDQYAIINTLVANSKPANEAQDLKIKQNDFLYSEAKANIPSLHPALSQDDVKTSAASRLNEIINSSYNKNSNLYQCTICNSTYNHPGNFKQHMLKHEREARNRMERGAEPNHLNAVLQSAFADRVDNGDPTKMYTCHECNRSFKHPGNFKQHMASHNRPTLSSANLGNRQSLDTKDLSALLSNVVDMAKKKHRPLPGLVKVEPDPSSLSSENHQRLSIDENRKSDNFCCPECKVSFTTDKLLQEHMKSKHDIEMIIPTANEGANATDRVNGDNTNDIEDDDSNGLEIMETEEGSEDLNMLDSRALISCDVPGCYQSFTTTGWLARHKTKMHPALIDDLGPSIFSCTQCGKVFNKMSKLSQHVKTHSPESHYRYPCDICGKKFTRPQHVNRHKLLHTGEKPFACNTCDKAFTREDKLKHHIKLGCPGRVLGHDIQQFNNDGEDINESIEEKND